VYSSNALPEEECEVMSTNALGTYSLITGVTTAAPNGQTQQTAASILSSPGGPLVVAIAGVIVILAGYALGIAWSGLVYTSVELVAKRNRMRTTAHAATK
jgi:hypothetical protein